MPLSARTLVDDLARLFQCAVGDGPVTARPRPGRWTSWGRLTKGATKYDKRPVRLVVSRTAGLNASSLPCVRKPRPEVVR
jgi:hypothetical protein